MSRPCLTSRGYDNGLIQPDNYEYTLLALALLSLTALTVQRQANTANRVRKPRVVLADNNQRMREAVAQLLSARRG